MLYIQATSSGVLNQQKKFLFEPACLAGQEAPLSLHQPKQPARQIVWIWASGVLKLNQKLNNYSNAG